MSCLNGQEWKCTADVVTMFVLPISSAGLFCLQLMTALNPSLTTPWNRGLFLKEFSMIPSTLAFSSSSSWTIDFSLSMSLTMAIPDFWRERKCVLHLSKIKYTSVCASLQIKSNVLLGSRMSCSISSFAYTRNCPQAAPCSQTHQWKTACDVPQETPVRSVPFLKVMHDSSTVVHTWFQPCSGMCLRWSAMVGGSHNTTVVPTFLL